MIPTLSTSPVRTNDTMPRRETWTYTRLCFRNLPLVSVHTPLPAVAYANSPLLSSTSFHLASARVSRLSTIMNTSGDLATWLNAHRSINGTADSASCLSCTTMKGHFANDFAQFCLEMKQENTVTSSITMPAKLASQALT